MLWFQKKCSLHLDKFQLEVGQIPEKSQRIQILYLKYNPKYTFTHSTVHSGVFVIKCTFSSKKERKMLKEKF